MSDNDLQAIHIRIKNDPARKYGRIKDYFWKEILGGEKNPNQKIINFEDFDWNETLVAMYIKYNCCIKWEHNSDNITQLNCFDGKRRKHLKRTYLLLSKMLH